MREMLQSLYNDFKDDIREGLSEYFRPNPKALIIASVLAAGTMLSQYCHSSELYLKAQDNSRLESIIEIDK